MAGLTVVHRALIDRNGQHFLKSHALRAQLYEIVVTLLWSAGLVFNRDDPNESRMPTALVAKLHAIALSE
jgi:hypothetical protein